MLAETVRSSTDGLVIAAVTAGAGFYGEVNTRPSGRVFAWLFRCKHSVSTGCLHYSAISEPRELYDDRTLLESYYSIGIETISSEQVEISIHRTAEEAESAAGRIAEFLKQEPGGRRIGVRGGAADPVENHLHPGFCWVLAGDIHRFRVCGSWELSRQ